MQRMIFDQANFPFIQREEPNSYGEFLCNHNTPPVRKVFGNKRICF